MKKYIFITGAGGLLGKNLIKNFIDKDYFVVATEFKDERLDDLKKSFNKNILIEKLDVTNEDQIINLFNKLYDSDKFPSVFINNAAVTGEWLMKEGKTFPSLKETSLNDWNMTLNSNLTGQFLISREIDRYIHKIKKKLSLINISTMYALRAPHHNIYKDMPVKSFCAYSASKAGVVGLSRWLAALWGEKCRVNVICPGGIFNNHSIEFSNRISNLNMLNRMADVNEISKTIEFLASDDASYITGEIINVDGGFSAW